MTRIGAFHVNRQLHFLIRGRIFHLTVLMQRIGHNRPSFGFGRGGSDNVDQPVHLRGDCSAVVGATVAGQHFESVEIIRDIGHLVGSVGDDFSPFGK